MLYPPAALSADAGVPIRNIKLLCVIASMPGLQQIMRELPGLEIFVAAVDQELSKDGYIVPGIGDRCGAVHACTGAQSLAGARADTIEPSIWSSQRRPHL